jgi:hypothetical protein
MPDKVITRTNVHSKVNLKIGQLNVACFQKRISFKEIKKCINHENRQIKQVYSFTAMLVALIVPYRHSGLWRSSRMSMLF